MCCALSVSVGVRVSPPSLTAVWKWWESPLDEVQRSDVRSLGDFLQVVKEQLRLEHPATLYVYPKGEDNDVREKVVDDEQLKTLIARSYIFYVWERVKGSPVREAKDGLPLTVRTRRDMADVSRRLSMGASSTATSPNHSSPPRPTLPSSPPAGLPKSPSPPTAARVLSVSSPSSPSSGNSPPSGDGSRTPGSQQGDMRKVVLERDSSRCVFTDKVLPPDNPLSMPVAHILPAEPSERLLHRDFVLWFETAHSDRYAKYKEYFVPRVFKPSKSVSSSRLTCMCDHPLLSSRISRPPPCACCCAGDQGTPTTTPGCCCCHTRHTTPDSAYWRTSTSTRRWRRAGWSLRSRRTTSSPSLCR